MRRPSISDLKVLESFHNGTFYLPDMGSSEVTHVEISDDCRSAAFVKLTSEVILLQDPSLSRISKAKRILEHFNSVKVNLPTSDTHVFICAGGDQFASILERHMQFERTEGISMWRKYGKRTD